MNNMTSKTIYFSTGTLSSGGAERVISILANNLAEEGHRITIFMWIGNTVFYKFDKRIRIISIQDECQSSSIIKKMLWLRNYVRNNRPNIFMSFLAIFNIACLFTLAGLKVKTIVCERNDPRFTPLQKPLRYVRNWIYRYADGILTQTKNNKNYFSDNIQKKTTVIYNPIFMDSSLVGSAKFVHKQKAIISIARLTPQKNQIMLIDAFAKFHKKHPDYKLYIYGEGPSREKLESHIGELELSDFIFLPGVVENVFEYLKPAEMFVLSSNFEGMPNSLLEAMCVGLPCISTKVSGAVDLIRDDENGFLIDINSTAQMSDRMCQLAEDKDLRYSIAEKASTIFDILNVDVISSSWKEYITERIKE